MISEEYKKKIKEDTDHSFEANSIQILGTVIPHYVGGWSRTRRRPVLYFIYFASFSITSILFFPLPVNTTNYSSTREYTADCDLLALTSRI